MDSVNSSTEILHFTEAQWTDYVRGIADGSDSRQIESHLESGCAECRYTVQWLTRIAQAGFRESEVEVPQDVVQRAREIFVARPSAPSIFENWQTIVAQLIREASLTWQPVGVRSPAEATGHVGERKVFRAGDYIVDLQLDAPGTGNPAEIVGQIAVENEKGESLDGIHVEMVIPGRTLTETSTNRFGEFVIACPAVQHAILRFALPERKQRIELPLSLRT
jgi:hypothetical protein